MKFYEAKMLQILNFSSTKHGSENVTLKHGCNLTIQWPICGLKLSTDKKGSFLHDFQRTESHCILWHFLLEVKEVFFFHLTTVYKTYFCFECCLMTVLLPPPPSFKSSSKCNLGRERIPQECTTYTFFFKSRSCNGEKIRQGGSNPHHQPEKHLVGDMGIICRRFWALDVRGGGGNLYVELLTLKIAQGFLLTGEREKKSIYYDHRFCAWL